MYKFITTLLLITAAYGSLVGCNDSTFRMVTAVYPANVPNACEDPTEWQVNVATYRKSDGVQVGAEDIVCMTPERARSYHVGAKYP